MGESRKGFPRGGGRVEVRHFAFHLSTHRHFKRARLSMRVGSRAIITDAKRVYEDSSRVACEKPRARLLLSPPFHHLCRFLSWESEELDERPHALFLTAERKHHFIQCG